MIALEGKKIGLGDWWQKKVYSKCEWK